MDLVSTGRMISEPDSDPVSGKVVWIPGKSLWIAGMTLVTVIGGPMTVSVDVLVMFAVLTALTICPGHSVGMHRLLIHRSFETPLWLERTLVYFGTLVGMAGPFGMIHAHDIRDWAQRQQACHDLFAHRRPFLQDAFWQMHCAVALDHPPRFTIENRVARDPFYRFLEATWMLQQVPLTLLLFAFGGVSWVVWGVAVRVAVSLTGHWLVGHFAHRGGEQEWRVDHVAVQGYNLPRFGLVTFGEAYHGNHHAFPESARLGIEAGQVDLGWWFIRLLSHLGLASEIKLPTNTNRRAGLKRVAKVVAGPDAQRKICPVVRTLRR